MGELGPRPSRRCNSGYSVYTYVHMYILYCTLSASVAPVLIGCHGSRSMVPDTLIVYMYNIYSDTRVPEAKQAGTFMLPVK